MGSTLRIFIKAFGLTKNSLWDVSLHQFRIKTSTDISGKPAPEGIHQDGHRFISMHMIHRENIAGGYSEIYSLKKEKLGQFFLKDIFDTLLVDDTSFMHNATEIKPLNHEKPAYRDLLVIDYNPLN